jgi:uncharacterized protein YkwD
MRWAWTALAFVALAAPAAAHADAGWTCGASAGWVASGGQRADAAGLGGDPCPQATGAAAGATNAGGRLSASGTLTVDGGPPSQTTDTRTPKASLDAGSLTIQTSDGKLVVNASNLHDEAQGDCEPSHKPRFASTSSIGSVTLDGRPIDSKHDYSEPGVGVNGAPLFGKITIRFGETAATPDGGVVRRALHVIVTDRNGNVVFEAAGGEVAAGRDGDVCAPPPVCPPGTQPQQGRCVQIQVTPLPPPPPPPPQLPVTPPGVVAPKPHPKPKPRPRSRGCVDTTARVGQVSDRRLIAATLCLLNEARAQHHLRKLRLNPQLGRAAAYHARAMVAGKYFAHDEPAGPSFVDRVLRSGYLNRYGRWKVGENLGWGWGSGGTPRALVKAWMRSAPHRRNILNAFFRDVGIAVHHGAPTQRRRPQRITYVVDFGGFQLARRTR